MAVDTIVSSGGREDDGIAHSPPLSRRRGMTSDSSLREEYIGSNPDMLHSPMQALQLPSPAPSPRSSSPSLVVTDSSSAEWDGNVDFIYGHKHSRSFENPKGSTLGDGINGPGANSPMPISKTLPPHELHDIPEEKLRKSRKPSISKSGGDDKILKLSPAEINELASTPESLPLSLAARSNSIDHGMLAPSPSIKQNGSRTEPPSANRNLSPVGITMRGSRPGFSSRAISTPPPSHRDGQWPYSSARQPSPQRKSASVPSRPEPLDLNLPLKPPPNKPNIEPGSESDTRVSSIPYDVPLPPLLSTYLQLELSSSRPSPLYIHRPSTAEYPYESSKIKFERLLNFLLLPPHLEQVLWFGALACLDAWLYTFTILPLRFVKAVAILFQWWVQVLAQEARSIAGFIYHGSGRMWDRQRGRGETKESPATSRSASRSASARPSVPASTSYQTRRPTEGAQVTPTTADGDAVRSAVERKSKSTWGRTHKRRKSQPSTLSSYHKADLLQGLIMICSTVILMQFDASRMYHSIKGQAALKLYVLYNVLEVADRLFSAVGQDIFECLTSDEILNRGVDGRSKILRPFGMFILALIYNVIHATALFYQVITLNVAVNSYSNALLTLLMSNQFVEVKSTVFKKFEKENLFQMTCADIVERFQLWMMLTIIGMRNVVEVGTATLPLSSNSILPNSFTILPSWTGDVLSPFLLVLGSEMVVDWIKHAYINKFNNVKPASYQKFLDVLAKDYYTNAFVNQNLVKRLGLPVIPLSCLFIRASVQTYSTFLATHLPPPIPSTATALSLESEPTASPATTAALEHFDAIIRKALGRSTFGTGPDGLPKSWLMLDSDDIIAFVTMLVFFLGVFLILLACKLVLGMLLLRFARNRYRTIKDRADLSMDTKGKRLGGWGMVEVDEEKKRWIYEDDPEGAKAWKEREYKAAQKEKQNAEKGVDFSNVTRYEMAAKRIW